jgi:hypothetical protein
MGKSVGGIVGAVGGYLGGKKTADAMGKMGALQQAAGQQTSGWAQFKPVAMVANPFATTTGTGGYTATAPIQNLQGQLADLYGISMGQAQRAAEMQPQYEQAAQGLFSMGQTAAPGATFDDVVSNILQKRFEARQPFEEEQIQQLGRTGFGRGAAGLRVAGGSPLMDEYLAQRDERVFEDEQAAIQEAMQRINFGAGLFGKAAQTTGLGYGLQTSSLDPTAKALAVQQATTVPGRQLYMDALQEANLRAQAGANAGRLYLAGALPSAQSYGMQGAVRGGMLSSLGDQFGTAISGMSNPFTGLFTSASANPMNIGLAGGGTFTQGAQVMPGSGGNLPWQNY